MKNSPYFDIVKMNNSLNLFVENFWKKEYYFFRRPKKIDIIHNVRQSELHMFDDRYTNLLSLFYFEFWTKKNLVKPPTVNERKEFIVKYIVNYDIPNSTKFHENKCSNILKTA